MIRVLIFLAFLIVAKNTQERQQGQCANSRSHQSKYEYHTVSILMIHDHALTMLYEVYDKQEHIQVRKFTLLYTT